jgi:hypothetical protein
VRRDAVPFDGGQGRNAHVAVGSRAVAAVLRGERVVLVEQTAQAVAAPDAFREKLCGRRWFCEGRTLLERAVPPLLVLCA